MTEALANLNEGIGIARRNGDLFWFPRLPNCIGWIHRELQDFEKAMEYDREGLELATTYNRNLMEAATKNRVGKYMAVAHLLASAISVARGDSGAAERQLLEAIDLVRQYPAPLVGWKVWAALGRLRRTMGAHESAQSAFAEAAIILRSIAANVDDEAQRNKFLNSTVVREVLEGCW